MKDKIYRRDSLKEFFSDGRRPTASHFQSLIDSMINKMDDGISKNMSEGLMLASEDPKEDKLISFKNNIQDPQAQWSINLENDTTKGLRIQEVTPAGTAPNFLFFRKGGNIGINTSTPQTHFDVKGILGTESRMGTHKVMTVPADGSWHDVLTGLNGYNALEIMAQVGKEKKGRHALLHATALSTFGRSRGRIRCTQAHYGWWWNKISLRWRGTTYNYKLQIRTRSNYGVGQEIKVCVAKLWDNTIMKTFENLTTHEGTDAK